MTPFAAALRESLIQSLKLLERAVTASTGLAADLRSLREGLSLDSPGGRDMEGDAGEAVDIAQAMEIAALAAETLAQLRSLETGKQGAGERDLTLLRRVSDQLGRMHRQAQSQRLQGLYVIVDPDVVRGEPLEVAAAALRGGARALQWRDKVRDKGDQLFFCQRLMELCERHDAIFIVNDHADLAAACGSHGLHLGQHDLPLEEARPLLKPHQLIGRSNATVEEAAESEAGGADYVAVGAIFPTGTKGNTRPAGLETLRRVAATARVPVIAISGIIEENVGEVIAAGADAVAVISAVAAAAEPEEAARRLVERIGRAREQLGVSTRSGTPRSATTRGAPARGATP